MHVIKIVGIDLFVNSCKSVKNHYTETKITMIIDDITDVNSNVEIDGSIDHNKDVITDENRDEKPEKFFLWHNMVH